jgi:hypothetical protein
MRMQTLILDNYSEIRVGSIKKKLLAQRLIFFDSAYPLSEMVENLIASIAVGCLWLGY